MNADPDNGLDLILAGCRQGDPLAWERLVRGYQCRVYGLVRHYISDREEARDVAQEVFVRLYRKLSTCPPADQFLPWILTVTRNACIDHLRRVRARPAARPDLQARELESFVHPGPSPEEDCDRSLLRRRIGRALEKLTALNREIILLKEIQGLSLEEIAGLLKVPLGTLKSRSHRARLELAEAVLGLDRTGRELGPGD